MADPVIAVGADTIKEIFAGEMGIKEIFLGDTRLYTRPGGWFYLELISEEAD